MAQIGADELGGRVAGFGEVELAVAAKRAAGDVVHPGAVDFQRRDDFAFGGDGVEPHQMRTRAIVSGEICHEVEHLVGAEDHPAHVFMGPEYNQLLLLQLQQLLHLKDQVLQVMLQ